MYLGCIVLFSVLFLGNAFQFVFPSSRFVSQSLSMVKNSPHTAQEPFSATERAGSGVRDAISIGTVASVFASSIGVLGGAQWAVAALGDDVENEAPPADYSKFTTTDSGLKYFDTKVGDGVVPVPGDTVQVHYTGWLDGFDGVKKFDSSYDRRKPLVFKAGVKQVISGWDEGLLTDLKVGGKRKLIIPASLGYGARGAGGVIPPNATLYFIIELVGIGAKRIR
jgi:peptidylprolyl isomerase